MVIARGWSYTLAVVAAAGFALAGHSAAAAPAGRVDFSIGQVTLTGADGRNRLVTKGLEVQSGDRIVTVDGRAQIRFTDGAYVSLQPNTDFSIREYRFDGKTDGTEKGVFALVRGALRTVTGAVGRVNRNAYQIQTPTATIGIRGTGGLIEILADGTTLVTGNSGTWSLANKAGAVDVPAGKAAKAGPNQAVPPSESVQRPVLPPPSGPLEVPLLPTKADTQTAMPGPVPIVVPGSQNEFVAGNNATASGSASSLAGNTLAGWAVIESFPGALIGTYPATVTLDSAGAMTSFSGPGISKTLSGGSALDVGADGPAAWGRWVGSYTEVNGTGTVAQTMAPGTSLHYFAAQPATNIPLSGPVAYFNFVGATSPTLASGAAAPGTFSGPQASVDFTSAKIGLNFSVAIGGNTYTTQTAGGLTNPMSSQVSLTAGPGTPQFSGGSVPCTPSCTTWVLGTVAGDGATHLGFGYKTQIPGDTVNGAAAYKR